MHFPNPCPNSTMVQKWCLSLIDDDKTKRSLIGELVGKVRYANIKKLALELVKNQIALANFPNPSKIFFATRT